MKKIFKHFVQFIISLMPSLRMNKTKTFLLKLLGNKIGNNVVIASSVKIMGNINISIGDNTFIGHYTMIIGGKAELNIGKNCDISSRVSFVMGTHEIGDAKRRAGKGYSKSITIGDGVWIGYGTTILPGVKIGDSSIIGAGSVVVHDIPANVIAAGNPCKVIKILNS
ncbi:MAG: DapH/DapD/GlmU-related protein [Bacteroidales bacterium]